jgi:hypothetical protein
MNAIKQEKLNARYIDLQNSILTAVGYWLTGKESDNHKNESRSHPYSIFSKKYTTSILTISVPSLTGLCSNRPSKSMESPSKSSTV